MTITDQQIWEQARRRIGFHQNRPDGRLSATVEDVEIMSFARDVLALAQVEAQPAAVAGDRCMAQENGERRCPKHCGLWECGGPMPSRTNDEKPAPAAPATTARDTQLRKALTLGLQHATWSKDRSRDPIEKRLNEQDVRVIEAALALLPPEKT